MMRAALLVLGVLLAGCGGPNLTRMAAQAAADYGCEAQVEGQVAEAVYRVRTCDGWHEYTGDEQFGYWEIGRPRGEAATGGPVHVRGYYRRDGTYVHPHTRRRPR